MNRQNPPLLEQYFKSNMELNYDLNLHVQHEKMLLVISFY